MIVTCAGLDQRTGEGFFHIEPTVGGWGAWEGSDGESGLINSVNAGMKDFPIEILETRIPLHVRRYGFRADSGGPGKWRGGNGVVREFEVECDQAFVSLWWERSKTPAWGLFGGGTATPPDLVINPGRADERHILKATRLVLERGDVIRGMSGGGGGFGNPAERAPGLVQADIRDGQVTREASARRYGPGGNE
jgi:N-methylhydantoinase B